MPRSPRSITSLLALNAALGALLLVLWIVPTPAGAQPTVGDPQSTGPAGSRSRGTYTMLAGRPRSGSGSAIYIIDSANQEAVSLRWNESKNVFDGLGYRNLARDLGQAPGR